MTSPCDIIGKFTNRPESIEHKKRCATINIGIIRRKMVPTVKWSKFYEWNTKEKLRLLHNTSPYFRPLTLRSQLSSCHIANYSEILCKSSMLPTLQTLVYELYILSCIFPLSCRPILIFTPHLFHLAGSLIETPSLKKIKKIIAIIFLDRACFLYTKLFFYFPTMLE